MKKLISLIILASLFLISCQKDVLDKKPLDLITDAAVWTDKNLMDAYLASAFLGTPVFVNECPARDNTTPPYYANAYYYGDICYINDIADESRAVSTAWWKSNYPNIKAGGIDINNSLFDYWDKGYRTIRVLNEFIEKAPESPVDESFKTERVAEARWLRAFNYFSLVKRYGGVPLITKTQSLEDPEEELYPVRDSEKAVYDFVISEIDAIAGDLYETGYGRPSKYAALALKCRAALYAGSIARYGNIQLDGLLGIPASEAQDYYQKSYDAAMDIISSAKFALYNLDADKVKNFKNMWLVKKNSEMIYVDPHDATNMWTGGMAHNYDFQQGPYPNSWDGNADGPYLEMVEEFEYADGTPGTLDRDYLQSRLWTMDELWGGRDPRFYGTFYTNGTVHRGATIQWHISMILPDGTIQHGGSYEGVLATGIQNTWGTHTSFGVYKLTDERVSTYIDAVSPTDWPVFRYAEILLNLSEAAFELGRTGEALDAVNQVRARAGMPAQTSIDMDKIRHERKVELAYENGHRYWDLRRWRMAEQALSRSFSGVNYYLDYNTRKYKVEVIQNVDGTSTEPRFYPYNYYLPVTLKRTGQNPNLVENPGYK